MAPKKPIVVTVPPGTGTTGKGSPYQQFIDYWRAHGYKNQLTDSLVNAIQLDAKAEKIDPVTFAALILNESRANPLTPDSSMGAIGIGQLEPGTFIGQHTWNKGVLPWNVHHVVTEADLRDPGTNMRLAAAYFGWLQGNYPADPYGRYNAGPNATDAYAGQLQAQFEKTWVSKWNPKYVPPPVSTTPPGKSGQQVPGGTAPPAQDLTFKDLYVAGVKKGTGGKFALTNDPNQAIQYDGAPLTRSSFLALKDNLTSHYISYTGQRPTNSQIEDFLYGGQKGKPGVTPQTAHAWSTYTLDVILSRGKNFTKSPIYKQRGIDLKDQVQDFLPQGGKIPPDLMRQAIVNQWSGQTLATELRKLPTYTASNDFKGRVASLLNTHDSIMGNAQPQDMVLVKDAALAGWNTDQYAAYLRQQPSYTHSTEYQSKALTFLSALGLITGHQAVLAPGVSPGPGDVQPNTQAAPAVDPRIKGTQQPPATPLAGLGVTFGG